MDNLNKLGQRMEKLRKDNNYNQGEIAEMLGVAPSTYSYYENGERNLNTTVLLKLSKIYDVSIDYLVGISEYSKVTENYLKTLSKLKLDKDLLKDEESVEIINKILTLSADTDINKLKLKALHNVFHSFKHYVMVSNEDYK